MNVSVSLLKPLKSFAATRTWRTTLLWEDLKPKTCLSFFIIIVAFVHFSPLATQCLGGGARFKQAPKRFCLLLPDWEQVVTWVKSSSVFWRASVEWFPELWVPLYRFWESSNLQRVPLVFWSCLAWMWWNWPHRSVHRHWFSMKSLKKKKKKN